MQPTSKEHRGISSAESTIDRLFNEMTSFEPKPMEHFVPSNAVPQKEAFLRDEIELPNHAYDRLVAIDFTAQYTGIKGSLESIAEALQGNDVAAEVYEQFGDRYLKVVRIMEIAAQRQQAVKPEELAELDAQFMVLNKELYGEPNESTYRSLINDSLNTLRVKTFTGQAERVYRELLRRLPRSPLELEVSRFEPSTETIEWAGRVVDTLYGNLLSHVPDKQASFTAIEIQQVFESILQDEFTDSESGLSSAEGWTVGIEKAQSINVKANDKKIVIPENKELSRAQLRGLVVHEIGVHLIRSVTGGQSDIGPLRTGLANYYDAEEGLGVVAQQALTGKYRVAGEGYYITAGLAYFDDMNFRETFEIKWRLAALSKLKDGDELTDDAVEKARSLAYGSTMRTFRGTDSLPWFKDLAYYNGADSVWRYLEKHTGDDTYVSLLFLGKADPSNDSHRRTLLESATK